MFDQVQEKFNDFTKQYAIIMKEIADFNFVKNTIARAKAKGMEVTR